LSTEKYIFSDYILKYAKVHIFLKWLALLPNLCEKMRELEFMEVAISGKGYVFRGQTPGVAGKVFQACGVALPPTLRAC
jgi:hypothetical protein